jgi:hypothetical protein
MLSHRYRQERERTSRINLLQFMIISVPYLPPLNNRGLKPDGNPPSLPIEDGKLEAATFCNMFDQPAIPIATADRRHSERGSSTLSRHMPGLLACHHRI